MFELHEKLRQDTLPVCRMKLCLVQLMNDVQYPWLILVPAAENLVEIADLNEKQRKLLINEIAQAQRVMKAVFSLDKLNVGAIGNIVEQLHIHVIGRKHNDPLWPQPVWGRVTPKPYEAAEQRAIVAQLQAAFIARV